MQLAFEDGRINGKGIDRVGKFLIEGKYSIEPKSLRFEKMYEGHSIRYVGTWNGEEIWGIWSIGFSDIGEFRLWLERKGPTSSRRKE